MLPRQLPVLADGRVRLRAFRETDVEVVLSVAGDPLIPLITAVPASGRREDALAYIERQHERLSSGMGYSFAIAEAATNVAVGQIGLWLQDYRYGRASIGYWITPRQRRRGFATAALRAVSRWAFALDGIARLELHVEPWNEGSWRAAERAGFRREGLLRGWQAVGQKRRDMYVYGVLAGEVGGPGYGGPPKPNYG
jgi:RimJ/RimL family protein N-acetyltransferase